MFAKPPGTATRASRIRLGLSAWILLAGLPTWAGHTLRCGESLAGGESLVSQNGAFLLRLEPTGLVVVYRRSSLPPELGPAPSIELVPWEPTLDPVWSSSHNRVSDTASLSLGPDNDLVAQDRWGILWHTDTANQGPAGTAVLVLDDDGTLFLRTGATIRWTSTHHVTTREFAGRTFQVFTPWPRVEGVRNAWADVVDSCHRLKESCSLM